MFCHIVGALLVVLRDKSLEQVWNCLKKGRIHGAMELSASPMKEKFNVEAAGDGSSMLGDEISSSDTLSKSLSSGYPAWYKVCLCKRESRTLEIYRLSNDALDSDDGAVADPHVRSTLHFLRGQAIHSLLDDMVDSLRSQEDLIKSYKQMASYKTTLEEDVDACELPALKPDALRMRANSAIHAYANHFVRSKLGDDPEYLDRFINDLKEASRLRHQENNPECEDILNDLSRAAKIQEEAKLLMNTDNEDQTTPLKNHYKSVELGDGESYDYYAKQLKKKSLMWHPDKHVNSDKEKQDQAAEKFMEVPSFLYLPSFL
jgi:hypothetical protein